MRSVFGLIATVVVLAGCGNPATSTPAPAPAHTPQPYSNLAQMMRGIPFTFANIVFDAQSQDPGAPRDPAAVAGGATATFKNVYGGWQEVENSALALAEAANLIMIPGRLCENGRPVPVDQPDFRAAAEGLAAAGRAAYEAAQSKNQDEMIAVSETVSVACAKCHEPYRDFDDQIGKPLPAEWSADKNIQWKAKVPGVAWSAPVIWGDKVLLTTAVTDNQRRPRSVSALPAGWSQMISPYPKGPRPVWISTTATMRRRIRSKSVRTASTVRRDHVGAAPP